MISALADYTHNLGESGRESYVDIRKSLQEGLSATRGLQLSKVVDQLPRAKGDVWLNVWRTNIQCCMGAEHAATSLCGDDLRSVWANGHRGT